ncbi:TetR/AcrR family transcriptional regulator [Brachybacterium fresconis]|uniref:AcrR family transcriptional regulator n=1 Tax=Brachybacterium fresconis TaxID=173363 RepID=A0ABS4YIW4_9MICO|nr:TetR/AcrR family transcriptional regulator [Brachybacterium fresconis]MBP2408730.1 AcrR family transcriptional regulator [Brachybacterium fresconis]
MPPEPSEKKQNRGPGAGPENRRALVAAARVEFSARGLTVPLRAIAQRAGVGQGSLYRHFPTRTALAAAVFSENIDELEAEFLDAESPDAESPDAESPDATPGLREFFAVIAEQAFESGELSALLRSAADDVEVAMLGERMRTLAVVLLERERRAGRLLREVTPEEISTAVAMVAAVMTGIPAAQRGIVAQRACMLVLAGIVRPQR